MFLELIEFFLAKPLWGVILILLVIIGVLLVILLKSQKKISSDSVAIGKSVKNGDVAIYSILKEVKKSSNDLCKKVDEIGVHNIKSAQVSEVHTRSLERIADKMSTISSDIKAFLYMNKNGKSNGKSQ